MQSIEQGNQAQSDVSEACQNDGFKLVMAGVIGLDDNDILSINKGSAMEFSGNAGLRKVTKREFWKSF